MSSQKWQQKTTWPDAELAATAGIKKDLYEIGEIPPLGHVPEEHVRLGHPQGTPRPA